MHAEWMKDFTQMFVLSSHWICCSRHYFVVYMKVINVKQHRNEEKSAWNMKCEWNPRNGRVEKSRVWHIPGFLYSWSKFEAANCYTHDMICAWYISLLKLLAQMLLMPPYLDSWEVCFWQFCEFAFFPCLKFYIPNFNRN